MSEPTLSRLINVHVLAGILGVAADTIYTMVSQRRIPYVKVGRLVRFDRNVIDEWLAKNTVMPLPEKRG